MKEMNFENKEHALEYFENELKEAIKKTGWINDDGGIEIYTDYRDKLSREQIVELFKETDRSDYGETPRERFDNLLYDWSDSYSLYSFNDDVEKLLSLMSDEAKRIYEEYEYECQDVLNEHLYYYFDKNFFNEEVTVNILLDTGNGNSDFTEDDVFSIYGDGTFKPTSSLLFVAKTQDREELLKNAAIKTYAGNEVTTESPFVNTVIQELLNNGSYMNTVTFCVKVKLFDLFDMWEKCKKKEGTITVSKDATTGLFNPWDGGGSLFEIQLEKDVEIPCKFIHSIKPDGYFRYDVKDVYGVMDSFWNGTVKMIPNVA